MLNPAQVQKTVAVLHAKFPQAVQEVIEFRGETTVVVDKAALPEASCQFLHDDPELNYNVLADLAAVDYSPAEPRFAVSYILFSMPKVARFRLKTWVPEEDPEVPTITGVYVNANWYEREAWDMMGIKFTGHPDLRRLLMPADWEGHPHRKDYPLGYEEVQFSFNWREIDAKKPYAKEQGMADASELVLEELKHLFSERALTGDTMVLNMGPQHPSTHGVLRLIVELDGETVIRAIPDIGFLHTGIEKNMESKTYIKALVMTERLDYLNNVGNNLAYCLAIEKLMETKVPERAQVLRVLMAELQRIASHLVWLGTHCIDLAAMSMLLYCFREREYIMDIFELVSGQRMMTSYIRPGGVWRDVPAEFEEAVSNFLDYFPAKLDDYERLLTNNPIFKQRTQNVGYIDAADAVKWNLAGPSLRGSGVNYDVRRVMPYCGYEQYEFDVPLETGGDVYARYRVRMREFRESIKIVRQALNRLKTTKGPFIVNDRKVAPPPRSEIGTSMEALIHHFKLWTEGFTPPVGEVYAATESPRGELGVYLVSDGTPKPQRVHFRQPSFANLQPLTYMSENHLVSDLVAIIGSVDIVLGDIDR